MMFHTNALVVASAAAEYALKTTDSLPKEIEVDLDVKKYLGSTLQKDEDRHYFITLNAEPEKQLLELGTTIALDRDRVRARLKSEASHNKTYYELVWRCNHDKYFDEYTVKWVLELSGQKLYISDGQYSNTNKSGFGKGYFSGELSDQGRSYFIQDHGADINGLTADFKTRGSVSVR